jgi:hypothetical protein
LGALFDEDLVDLVDVHSSSSSTIVFSTDRIIARITRADEPRIIEKIVVYDTCRIPDLLVFPI